MKFSKNWLTTSLLSLMAGAALASGPDGYPSRPVTIIVPFAPGGGSDNVARIVATRLTERTGGTFIIGMIFVPENKDKDIFAEDKA